MAVETKAQIGADDFRMLNRCLDDAIASAITEHGRDRDAATAKSRAARTTGCGSWAMPCTASVLAARGAFEAIQSGKVGIDGSTGVVAGAKP